MAHNWKRKPTLGLTREPSRRGGVEARMKRFVARITTQQELDAILAQVQDTGVKDGFLAHHANKLNRLPE
jgi:DNA-binding sugar fermentation-stimulating protein